MTANRELTTTTVYQPCHDLYDARHDDDYECTDRSNCLGWRTQNR